MKQRIISIALSALTLYSGAMAKNTIENIDRGVVALPASQGGIFLSWRLLVNDTDSVRFDVLRNGEKVATDIIATNFEDKEGTGSSLYSIVTKQRGVEESSQAIKPWDDMFLSIPVNRPEPGIYPDGKTYTYSPNDCSVGDVDGDGQYEIMLKWDPSNSHDNSHDGYTGDVIIDCYKLDGKQLWRVNLGRNIRAGAHYTQFLVYDFDGDGKAEMICKTAPGSLDGTNRFVSLAATDSDILAIDNKADYRTERGRILQGEELLTVFDGLTGKALHTVWYNPNRAYGVGGKAEYAGWGDKNIMGNRGERYLGCVAHLDGIDRKASAVMCRGYYTMAYLWAVDFDGRQLSTKWLHASLSDNDWKVYDGNGTVVKEAKGLKATAYGQGAHGIAVADVDGDGCDEITFGSAAINNDGSLLYSTGLGHGDAFHLADLDPDRPGLEFFMVHESHPYGADLRDAHTGELLFHQAGSEDTGRGMAADIDPDHRGCEMWHICEQTVRNVKGDIIAHTKAPMNFRIYWDGDLEEELLGNLRRRPLFPPCLYKWDGQEAQPLPLGNGKQIYETGNSNTCNWTKATPNLQADIMGDWREELIFWDASDSSHLNIYTTNTPTDYRVTTLMHDHVYRMSVAWQNVSYNQPPHIGYWLKDKAVKTK